MSGLYIPGLSMPRKTGIVSIVLSGDGSALLCEDGAYSEIKVIPVPDHGDLIDKDALIKGHFSDEHRIAMSYADKCWMRRIINGEPTIIEAEVGEG